MRSRKRSFRRAAPGSADKGWLHFDGARGGFVPRDVGFAVVTLAGKHTLATTLDALGPHIAPIETLAEAQAWASLHRNGATCESGSPNASGSGNSFDLRSIATTCEGATNGSVDVTRERIVRVYRDGRIEQGAPRELGASGATRSARRMARPSRSPTSVRRSPEVSRPRPDRL